MKAIGGLWWGSNKPGGFGLGIVRENRRVHIVADLEFEKTALPEVVSQFYALAESRECSLGPVYADEDLFDIADAKAAKTLKVESIGGRLRSNGLSMIPISGHITHGWQLVRDFMRDAPDGQPWVLVDDRCESLTRTIRTVIQSKNDPDEAAGELHMAHALRCLLSSQPAPHRVAPKKDEPQPGTVGYYKLYDQKHDRPGVLTLPGSRVSYGR